MKSKTSSLKATIKELDFSNQLLFNKRFEEKRFIVSCKQINTKNT